MQETRDNRGLRYSVAWIAVGGLLFALGLLYLPGERSLRERVMRTKSVVDESARKLVDVESVISSNFDGSTRAVRTLELSALIGKASVDAWGRPVRIIIRPYGGDGAGWEDDLWQYRIYSIGPDGVDESGLGDDIASLQGLLKLNSSIE